MKVEGLREKPLSMLKYEITKVGTFLLNNEYKGFFVPTFYCELNPIETVWAQLK